MQRLDFNLETLVGSLVRTPFSTAHGIKTLIRKKNLEGKEHLNFVYKETDSTYTRREDIKELQLAIKVITFTLLKLPIFN